MARRPGGGGGFAFPTGPNAKRRRIGAVAEAYCAGTAGGGGLALSAGGAPENRSGNGAGAKLITRPSGRREVWERLNCGAPRREGRSFPHQAARARIISPGEMETVPQGNEIEGALGDLGADYAPRGKGRGRPIEVASCYDARHAGESSRWEVAGFCGLDSVR